MIINRTRHRRADASDFSQIRDACPQHALQPAEMGQYGAPPCRSQPRYGLEYGLAVTARAPPAVAGNRESMRFIAHALDEMQGRAVGFEHDRRRLPGPVQTLLTRPPVGTLGHANDRQPLDPGLGQRPERGIDLPGSAVDQQQIGTGTLAAGDAGRVTAQRLMHGGVVVAGRDPLDVVAPVVALARAFWAEHHTGGHRALARGMTHIEAFRSEEHTSEL